MSSIPKNVENIFWDWHGVLGVAGFWNEASKSNPEVKLFCNRVFKDYCLLKQWMRGDVSFTELVTAYAPKKLTEQQLLDLYYADQKASGINEPLFMAISYLFPDAKHYLITDNMDIFTKAYVERCPNIFARFSKLFISCDMHCLKQSEQGNLFEKALAELGLADFSNSILIDDNKKNCQLFSFHGGGHIHLA